MATGSEQDRHGWERAGAFQVVEGVHRIPLPLPGDGLRAVNVYAIEQPDGVVLIDAGWAIDEARDRLQAGLAALDHDLGSIRRILVTHVHRDHYELGLQLRRRFGSRLELGIGERSSLRGLVADVPPEESGLLVRLRLAGAQPLVAQLAQLREGRAQDDADALPIGWELPDHWLQGAEVLELAGRTLEVVATPGHTQGHVVFVDRRAGVLFSGDHVLPHITPSIGFEHAPVGSALADYLASLALVRSLPDLRMVPAHGPVRPTTHDRVDELIGHHEDRLRASLEAIGAGRATAYEVARALGWTRRERAFDELDAFNQMLAVNETMAHLDVLVGRDELAVSDEDGINLYAA